MSKLKKTKTHKIDPREWPAPIWMRSSQELFRTSMHSLARDLREASDKG